MAAPMSAEEDARRLAAVQATLKNGSPAFIEACRVLQNVKPNALKQWWHNRNFGSSVEGVSPPVPQQPSVQAPVERKVFASPASTRVVLMTAAQDETIVAPGAIKALETYAGYRNAEILIGGFTYQKGLFEDHTVMTGKFVPEVAKYLRPEVIELAPRLVWFGKANILPTNTDPLSGWDTQTRDAWTIFPHAKIALKCVPTMPGKPGKQVMSTGVVTKENYVQRNSGQKAEFHHTIGATVAEICPDGTFFCRQIKIARDGSFQDLDFLVRNDRVEKAPPVEAITFGDLHFEVLDHDKAKASWGWPNASDSMLDMLRPKYQFIHDSFDFTARNHHTRNDPHERVMRLHDGNNSVRSMLAGTAAFLSAISRQDSKVVHVGSNHNDALTKWLKDPAGLSDPVNARLWCELNAAQFAAIEEGDKSFNLHEHALKLCGHDLSDVIFVQPGEQFVICQGVHPIECGLHGHAGPRGARGSLTGFAKMVERTNIGHSHEPGIKEGAYQAGTSSRLDLSYASKGPTAWHHADIVTYQNGARAIISPIGSKWRA